MYRFREGQAAERWSTATADAGGLGGCTGMREFRAGDAGMRIDAAAGFGADAGAHDVQVRANGRCVFTHLGAMFHGILLVIDGKDMSLRVL